MEIELKCRNLHRNGLIGGQSVGISPGANLQSINKYFDGILPNFIYEVVKRVEENFIIAFE